MPVPPRSCGHGPRSRPSRKTDENIFAGSREDHLRNEDGRWRIYKRVVVLDSNVILAKNLSVFF